MINRLYNIRAISKGVLLVLSLVVTLAGITLFASLRQVPQSKGPSVQARTIGLGQLPLSFEPNVGQAGSQQPRYMVHSAGGTLFFAPSEVVLALVAPEATKANMTGDAPRNPKVDRDRVAFDPVRLQFIGSNPSTAIRQGGALPGRVSYLKGKDTAKWHTDLPTYSDVTYSDLYPGINLEYTGKDGQLKGTYTLAPGTDPASIRWLYRGASGLALDEQGNLQMTVGNTALKEEAPQAWQEIDGRRVTVSSRYVILADGTVGFALGEYDHLQPLVIDPTLTYSTYLGGFYGDWARGVTVDSAGNMYIVGSASSSDFPLQDPYQPLLRGGNNDAFIAKFSADGSTLLYSTFLGGGPGPEGTGGDSASFISVDGSGNMIVAGLTDSLDFPTTPGAYQTEFSGPDSLFVTKLNATGSSLIFSTYIGYLFDDGGFAVDSAGNTYFTSYFYPGFNRYVDVGKLNSTGTDLIFDRAIGGEIRGPGDDNSDSAGQGLTLDSAGNLYITGYTRAADFPVTFGAYRTQIERYEDGFVMKLNPTDGSTIYSTYIPGNVSEYPYDIAADDAGNAYITGYTLSHNYPTTAGAFQTSCGDPTCAMLTKLNPTGSALVYSTYLGGLEFHFSTQDIGYAVRLNQAGNAYVSGYTRTAGFPVMNPIQATLNGTQDAFLTKFNPDGTGIEFSTFLGGSGGEGAVDMTFDNQGNIYLVGGTSSADFPMVQPYQPTSHGGTDAFIAKISEASPNTTTPTRTGTPPTATSTATPTCGAINSWQAEPPFSAARDYATGAAADGKFYVIGGWAYVPSPTYVAQVQRFDPATSSWATVAPIPIPSTMLSAAAIGNKIYVAGGWGPSPYFETNFMQIYDTSTNTWSQGAAMPLHLSSPAVAAYNGKIYIFGGSRGYPDYGSNMVFEYDPIANTYATKAPMPAVQDEIGAAAVGNRIYVVGGYQYVHWVYDPAADAWSTIANPPISTGFSNPGVFALNGELWVVGGYDNYSRRGYPPNQEIQIYNPTTNSWHFGPAFNTPRSRSRATGVIDGRAYVAGGADLGDDRALLTSLESITYVPCGTVTPTATPVGGSVLVGHVNWEARPAQPSQLQMLPITLTLKLGTTEVNYPTQPTDQYGFFTVTLGSLPSGIYSWRVDDSASALHSPNYLANSGVIDLSGQPVTNVEMGLMRAGDANNDNLANIADFNVVKVAFGYGCGDPPYDNRADFTGDCFVNVSDFNPLKRNFGRSGGPPIGPLKPK